MAVDKSQRKEWAKEHFRGAENIVLPSFKADLSELDEDGVRLDVRQSIRHGVFSTFCSIEAGLSVAEKKRFMEIVADEAGDEICVGFALCGDSLAENIELLEHGERIGASHALVSYPHTFYPRSQDEIHDFIRAMCDATNLGICLFQNDKFGFHRLHPSGVPFDAFDRLADVPNVVAMKVSSPDLAVATACFDRYGDRMLVSVPVIIQFPVICQAYDMQWTGAWTIEAFQSPEQRQIIEMLGHFGAGRVDEAMGIFWRLGPLLKEVGERLAEMMPTGIYHWTLFKYFQWLTGGNGGAVRQPAMRLSASDMADVRTMYQYSGIQLADGDDGDFFTGRSLLEREAVAR